MLAEIYVKPGLCEKITHEHAPTARRMPRAQDYNRGSRHLWVESVAVDTSLNGSSAIIRHGTFMWKPKPENFLAALTLQK